MFCVECAARRVQLRAIKAVWSQHYSYALDSLLHGFLRFSEGGRFHHVIIVGLRPCISPYTSGYFDRLSREPNLCASAHQAVKDRPLPPRCRCLSWTERQWHLPGIINLGIHGCQRHSFGAAVHLQRWLPSIPRQTGARRAAGVVVISARLLRVY